MSNVKIEAMQEMINAKSKTIKALTDQLDSYKEMVSSKQDADTHNEAIKLAQKATPVVVTIEGEDNHTDLFGYSLEVHPNNTKVTTSDKGGLITEVIYPSTTRITSRYVPLTQGFVDSFYDKAKANIQADGQK